jgi:hypothetical protein
MSKLVCEVPEGFNPSSGKLKMSYMNVNGLECFTKNDVPFKVAEVRLKKTKEEKNKAKRIYRKSYVNKPLVKERMKKRLEDPETVAKRKEYSQRPEVKQRKKDQAALNRRIRNALKHEHSALYLQIARELEENGSLNATSV